MPGREERKDTHGRRCGLIIVERLGRHFLDRDLGEVSMVWIHYCRRIGGRYFLDREFRRETGRGTLLRVSPTIAQSVTGMFVVKRQVLLCVILFKSVVFRRSNIPAKVSGHVGTHTALCNRDHSLVGSFVCPFVRVFESNDSANENVL